ncbi:DUF4402 domain-containing protein [Altererythrobacter sp. Z27]|uniref:DUF4402 domain-containing protein n=1 Tax=Altererythrobacter sp. Z27 TaxID=3461147 RepID=UPI0040449C99
MPAPSSAQPGEFASANGSATATVVSPLRLEAVAPLEFGPVGIPAEAGGSITISPLGAPPTYLGTLQQACSAHDSCMARPARFAVRGEAGRHYRVEYPTEAPAHPVSAGGPSLTVTGLIHAFENRDVPGGRGLLGPGGDSSFRIGGTLEVPEGTPAGIYRATLDVVVSYD